MRETFVSYSPYDTAKLANSLAPMLGKGDALLLHGDVGAGKTDFSRKIIQNRMVKHDTLEDVPSPTFTLVQSYQLGSLEFVHADLYRISHPDEVFELGLERAFEEAVCLVEWPDRLGSLAPKNALNIEIAIVDDTTRTFRFFWTDENWSDRIATLTSLVSDGGNS